MALSKLNLAVRTPDSFNKQSEYDFRKDVQNQINALTEGRISAVYNAMPSAPVNGDYAVGDFVRNSTPSELGTIGIKYIITGWICTNISPLTFNEARVLTGN